MELYPYQKTAINALWGFLKETPRGVPLIVAPTGSGKSLLISEIIRKVIEKKPEYKILIVSHRKEILTQNISELQGLMPTEIIGIWSAGLRMKKFRRVTYCNIQSVFKTDIPPVELVICDEAHLVPKTSDTMYQKFFKRVLDKNPKCKIIGLTATPYRLDQGHLIDEGGLFTDIAYDISIGELIEQGYLAPLISRVSKSKVDLSDVRKSGYDYNQTELENKFDPLTEQHCDEIIAKGSDRKHWLIFCSGVRHAEHVADCLTAKGIPALAVHGELLDMERDRRINLFKAGAVRAITNVNVLTTGFNFKPIDLLVLLRATTSTALFVQMCGRGTRTAEGKQDCCVLDFGGNIEKHGPIDLIEVTRAKKNGKAVIKKMPVKACPVCGAVVSIKKLTCFCGHEFPLATTKLVAIPTERSILSEIEEIEIKEMIVKKHEKPGKPPSLRIDYCYGQFGKVSDFLCFEHGGYASTMARQKWVMRGGTPPAPLTTEEALVRRYELKDVQTAKVRKDGKYFRILSVMFAPEIFEEEDPSLPNL